MAVSFNKEVILEAIQEVLAEDQKIPVRVSSKSDPSDTGSIEVMDRDKMNALKRTGKVEIDPMEEDHHENPNDDSDMAKSQLHAIAKYALALLQMIKDGDPLDAWVQAKITKAADYIDAVQHYLEGEEYLDANQDKPEEELAESDYEPRTKEDLVFQYLRDAWQFGATKGKDVNPDEELSIMADSLLANLPDYDTSSVDEGIGTLLKKGLKGAITNLPLPKESLLKVVDLKIEDLLQNGGNVLKIAQLKGFLEDKIKDGTITTIKPINQMIAKVAHTPDGKSAFEKRLDKMRDQQNPQEEVVSETLELDEIKAGEFAKIKKGTKIGMKSYGYVTVLDNDGVVIKVKDQFGEVFPINLGQYNEKVLNEGVSCCGRCGRVHESAQDCKKPYISKDSPRHCKNKK